MIGSRIALVPPPPWAALAWVATGIVLGAAGAAFGVAVPIFLAALPLAVGSSLIFTQHRRFRARFTPTALEVARPQETIPYVSIREVRPAVPLGNVRPRAFAIEVVHDQGSVLIPASLSAPSERVYVFLRERLPATPETSLPDALATYRQEQEHSFGADRVWSFGARRGPYSHSGPGRRAAVLALFLVAIVWFAIPLFRKDEEVWFGLSGAAVGIAVLILLFDWAGRRQVAQGSQGAALVITPLGLALRQGGLDGHLTWQEIRKVTLRPKAPPLAVAHQRAPGIALEVEGATIVITDSYDRPLADIHERIRQYWR